MPLSPLPVADSVQNERETIKNNFIAKKQACRANIKMLPESLGILKEKELKDLQVSPSSAAAAYHFAMMAAPTISSSYPAGVIATPRFRVSQEEYREVDGDFKSLGLIAERGALLEGTLQKKRCIVF